MSFADVFEEVCPVYMAYGMTYDEFWNGNPKMVIAYRKAHELDIKRRNEEMWLQGLYNFKAFSTALSNLHFDGKSHKANRYLEKPIDLFEKTEEEKQTEAEIAKQKVIDSLNRFKEQFDKRNKANGKCTGSGS